MRAASRRLLLAGIVYKALAFAVVTPVLGGLLRMFVGWSGSAVLADQDILFFLLSPLGAVAFLVMTAVTLVWLG